MKDQITHFSKEQIIDFIKAQPDDRLINFSEPGVRFDEAEPRCGCLMVHMMKHTHPDLLWTSCGYRSADGISPKSGRVVSEFPSIRATSKEMLSVKNYGGLKGLVNYLFDNP